MVGLRSAVPLVCVIVVAAVVPEMSGPPAAPVQAAALPTCRGPTELASYFASCDSPAAEHAQ